MSCEFEVADHPTLVFRLARKPDPWDWPETSANEPSMNRWDDPLGLYGVLYASSTAVGAYIECLARFRRDVATEAGLAAVLDDQPTPFRRPGTLAASWLQSRVIGEAVLAGTFCDITAAPSLTALRHDLAARLIHYGLDDLDLSTITSGNRALTKDISRHVYECSRPNGQRRFAGIAYPSRFGPAFTNWALFQNTAYEDTCFVNVRHRDVVRDDPELVEALRILRLEMV